MRFFSALFVLAIATCAAADVPVAEKLRDPAKKDSQSSGGSAQRGHSGSKNQKDAYYGYDNQQDRHPSHYDGQHDGYSDDDEQVSGNQQSRKMGAKDFYYPGSAKYSGNTGYNGRAKTLSVCTKVHNFIGDKGADSDSAPLYTCNSNNLATNTKVGRVQYICYPGTNPDASGKGPQTELLQECSMTLHIKGNDVTYWQTFDPATGQSGTAEFVRDLQTGKFEDLHFVQADYVIEAGKALLPTTSPNFNFYNVGELHRLHYFGKTFHF